MIYIVLPEGVRAIESDSVISSTNAERAAELARSAAKETGTPHVVYRTVAQSYHKPSVPR